MGYVDVPVFVTCRDRVSDLRLLVDWLEKAGHQRIILLDNDSGYEPLLEYYRQSPHAIYYLKHNYGSRALWHADLVPNEPFVLTDPDIVPLSTCPHDLVGYLGEILDAYWLPKAGPSLYTGSLPEHCCKPNPLLEGMSIKEWEDSLISTSRELGPGIYDSLIDTTFALYRSGSPFGFQAIRLGPPWQAKHLSWYRTSIDAEHAYYLSHATHGPEGTTWKPPENT